MVPQAISGFFSPLSKESLKFGVTPTSSRTLHPILAKAETIYETKPDGFILTSVVYGAEGDIPDIFIEVCSPRASHQSYKDRHDALVIQRILNLVAKNALASATEEGKGIYRTARQAKQAVHQAIKDLHGIHGKAGYFRFAHVHFRSFDKLKEARMATKPYITQGQGASVNLEQACQQVMNGLKSTRQALEREWSEQKQRRMLFAEKKRKLDMDLLEDGRTARWIQESSFESCLSSVSFFSPPPSYRSQSCVY
ncbi:hypothetical protein L202_00644 [Cryptococcus amylolentus CBS 6039]|uniref:Uncharacterized protein n=1 Tax=Cryptococcus amylolentus CBS 6039 TaxID=1295533 RepID=A0A1E3I823_9TREE|nr:hypothetical protein L202_00644 [Cryptococcus amylolentus CBS 6039]ODN84770.1 hypothetical protein L202_00644 [Cryptococcus amylolentus CBS 6039]